jgi:DNA polymerase III delta prime subunit
MAERQGSYENQYLPDINTKIRDLEEKNRMLKDRLLLIGQNLIEIKEKTNSDLLEIKKDFEIMKRNMERLISFLETASAEFSKFARKEDLEILSKQAKMFQPLEFVRKKDLKKLKE